MAITTDIQSAAPGALVELFELDTTAIQPPGTPNTIYRFHAGVNYNNSHLVFAGNMYTAYPVECTGFEVNSKGTLPRPSFKVANVMGLVGLLNKQLNDLVGSKVTRIRTFAKYLDAVNFPAGNPTADPTVQFTPEVFYINRKVIENKVLVEYELSSVLEMQNVQIPRRQMLQDTCIWAYRGAECGYTGTVYWDLLNNPVADPLLDVCGKRLSSCKLRFPSGPLSNGIPFGGFPGCSIV